MNLDGHEACMIKFFSMQKLENFVLKKSIYYINNWGFVHI